MKQMGKYIALLRGINVSGQKIIKMADLRLILEELNFNNIKTYIQSGNVIFENEIVNAKDLEDKMRKLIFKHYGFHVKIIVKTLSELETIFTRNPFFLDGKKALKHICVTFLSDIPNEENTAILKTVKHDDEEYILDGKSIYLYAPNGFGRAKLTNNLFEKKLKVNATTRNCKTINKLIEIAKGK